MFDLVQAGAKTYYIDAPVKIGMYKITDTEICLIDTGTDKSAAKKIAAIADGNGWTIQTIINTHSHADHCGGNAYLQQKYGCEIYAAPIEATFIEHPILEPAFLYGGYPDNSLHGRYLWPSPAAAGPSLKPACPQG